MVIVIRKNVSGIIYCYTESIVCWYTAINLHIAMDSSDNNIYHEKQVSLIG